jgi:hypothetical protein
MAKLMMSKDGKNPTDEVSETGSITAETGAFQYVTDLSSPMSDVDTHVNIHTEQNPWPDN